MRKNNRKGFTIVELVIVIAVIAILAGVLIPTFANVVSNAKESAALQEAKNMYSEYIGSLDYSEGEEAVTKVYVEIDDEYIVLINNGEASIVDAEDVDATIPTLEKTETGYSVATEATESGDDADAGEGETPDENPGENNGQ